MSHNFDLINNIYTKDTGFSICHGCCHQFETNNSVDIFALNACKTSFCLQAFRAKMSPWQILNPVSLV